MKANVYSGHNYKGFRMGFSGDCILGALNSFPELDLGERKLMHSDVGMCLLRKPLEGNT